MSLPSWRLSRACVSAAALLTAACLPMPGHAAAPAADTDPVVFHFATVGDSRQDPKDPRLTIHDAPFLQATRVLARIERDVEAAHAQAFIFLGDMIMGYTPDRSTIDREYAYWRGMMAPLLESGTYVLPVPGNHETELKEKHPDGRTTKLAQVSQEDAWRASMGDLVLDTALWEKLVGTPASHWSVDNTPQPGHDAISSDQRQLTYSFDTGIVHIEVINTDPTGADGTAPVEWMRTDMAVAKARGARVFLVFGHKMAFGYEFPTAKKIAEEDKEYGLDTGHPNVRDAFWQTIEQFHATYFCGHEHIYHASQPTRDQGGGAWQVIIGSGGSPLAAVKGGGTDPIDLSYAWAEVWAHQSGRLHVTIHGFDESFQPSRTFADWDIPAAP